MPTSTPSAAKTGRGKNGNPSRRPSEEPNSGTYSGAERAAPTADQIAQRAYEIYEREGRQEGHDLENWLAAEAELLGSNRTRS
jgi:hypothetical protein